MGYYVNVKAYAESEKTINQTWSKLFDEPLIFTQEIIEAEIQQIQLQDLSNGSAYTSIHTIKDWNAAFPVIAEHRGQVFIDSICRDNTTTHASDKLLIEKIEWIINHRVLFEWVSGLSDAQTALGMEIPFDAFNEGAPLCDVSFTLDIFYQAFLSRPTPDAWDQLKNFLLPTGQSIWQACEHQATHRDGQDYGLKGRFREGLIPSEFEIRRIMRGHQS